MLATNTTLLKSFQLGAWLWDGGTPTISLWLRTPHARRRVSITLWTSGLIRDEVSRDAAAVNDEFADWGS